MSVFSRNLIRYRKATNLSQEDLSKRSGVSQQAISMIEAEKRSPTEYTMRQLASGIGVSLNLLLLDENEKSPPATEASGADERERLVNLLMEVPDDRIQEAIDLLSTLQRVRRQ